MTSHLLPIRCYTDRALKMPLPMSFESNISETVQPTVAKFCKIFKDPRLINAPYTIPLATSGRQHIIEYCTKVVQRMFRPRFHAISPQWMTCGISVLWYSNRVVQRFRLTSPIGWLLVVCLCQVKSGGTSRHWRRRAQQTPRSADRREDAPAEQGYDSSRQAPRHRIRRQHVG